MGIYKNIIINNTLILKLVLENIEIHHFLHKCSNIPCNNGDHAICMMSLLIHSSDNYEKARLQKK